MKERSGKADIPQNADTPNPAVTAPMIRHTTDLGLYLPRPF